LDWNGQIWPKSDLPILNSDETSPIKSDIVVVGIDVAKHRHVAAIRQQKAEAVMDVVKG
jgi:hypothetical protein